MAAARNTGYLRQRPLQSLDPVALGEVQPGLTEAPDCGKGATHFHEPLQVSGRFEKVGAVRPAFFFHLSREASSGRGTWVEKRSLSNTCATWPRPLPLPR